MGAVSGKWVEVVLDDVQGEGGQSRAVRFQTYGWSCGACGREAREHGQDGGQRASVVHGLVRRPAGLAPVRRTRPQIHRTPPECATQRARSARRSSPVPPPSSTREPSGPDRAAPALGRGRERFPRARGRLVTRAPVGRRGSRGGGAGAVQAAAGKLRAMSANKASRARLTCWAAVRSLTA